jgi:precorrin-6B methylase 2
MRLRGLAGFALLAAGLSLAPLRAQEDMEFEVPYVPTPENVVAKMLELADVKKGDVLYDLGSGDGRIVVTAARKYGVHAVGYDLNPERIREANDNAKAAGVTANVEFRNKDLFTADLKEASVVTLYLLPSVNLRLRPKLFAELKPGSRVVSHDFDMGDWKPDKTVALDGHKIYYWIIPRDAANRK